MLSILSYSLPENPDSHKFEISVIITSIIYVIIHYFIFKSSISFIQRFKYVFYGFVLVDIIVALKHYNSLFKVVEVVEEVKETPKSFIPPQPAFIIEKPYLDTNDVHQQQYIPIGQSEIEKAMSAINGANVSLHPAVSFINQPLSPITNDSSNESSNVAANIDSREKDMKMEAMNEILNNKKKQEIINEVQNQIVNQEINKLKETFIIKNKEDVKEDNNENVVNKEDVNKENDKDDENVIEKENVIDNDKDEIQIEPIEELTDSDEE